MCVAEALVMLLPWLRRDRFALCGAIGVGMLLVAFAAGAAICCSAEGGVVRAVCEDWRALAIWRAGWDLGWCTVAATVAVFVVAWVIVDGCWEGAGFVFV